MGLGKPLKLLAKPVQSPIPVYLGAVGPKSIEQTGEIADGWLPAFLDPSNPDVLMDPLRAGLAKAGRDASSIDVAAALPVAVGEDVDSARDACRPWLAFYLGAMGAREKNFYVDLADRYGHGDVARDVQARMLDGDRMGAAGALTPELIDATALVCRAGGPRRAARGLRARRRHDAARGADGRPRGDGPRARRRRRPRAERATSAAARPRTRAEVDPARELVLLDDPLGRDHDEPRHLAALRGLELADVGLGQRPLRLLLAEPHEQLLAVHGARHVPVEDPGERAEHPLLLHPGADADDLRAPARPAPRRRPLERQRRVLRRRRRLRPPLRSASPLRRLRRSPARALGGTRRAGRSARAARRGTRASPRRARSPRRAPSARRGTPRAPARGPCPRRRGRTSRGRGPRPTRAARRCPGGGGSRTRR